MQAVSPKHVLCCILRDFFSIAPFNAKGDLSTPLKASKKDYLSCLVVSNRPQALGCLLEDLSMQALGKELFEVVVVADGREDECKKMVEKFEGKISVVCINSVTGGKSLSDLRNISIEHSFGEIILFLDDDSRLFDHMALEKALAIFQKHSVDVLVPQARALYGLVRQKYDFLDRFSLTTRAVFYRRKVLEELGGFKKGMNAYEDIELSIRVMCHKYGIVRTADISYWHPPLYFYSMRKPLAIGQSIFQMRHQYSFPVWLLVYLNSLRFLAFGLFPFGKFRQWFKISFGVLAYPFVCGSYFYREGN